MPRFCFSLLKSLVPLALAVAMPSLQALAQDSDPLVSPAPRLDFVMDLDVALDGDYVDVGRVPDGHRGIVPITGGSFHGPALHGEILAGGADYQLRSANTALSQLNAIYSIRTHDGVNIFVHNRGIISGSGDSAYFYTTPRFEAPVDSRYAWLNDYIYVCRPMPSDSGIRLRVWRVCDADALPEICPEPAETR